MRRVVIDTSALIASVEHDRPAWGETVLRLQVEGELLAPALLSSEAGNVVLRKRPAAFGRDAAERAEFLEVLLTGIALLPPDAASRRRAAHLVERHGLAFYDAEFLEVADRDDATALLTQDHALHAAGRATLGAHRALTLDEAGDALARGAL